MLLKSPTTRKISCSTKGHTKKDKKKNKKQRKASITLTPRKRRKLANYKNLGSERRRKCLPKSSSSEDCMPKGTKLRLRGEFNSRRDVDGLALSDPPPSFENRRAPPRCKPVFDKK